MVVSRYGAVQPSLARWLWLAGMAGWVLAVLGGWWVVGGRLWVAWWLSHSSRLYGAVSVSGRGSPGHDPGHDPGTHGQGPGTPPASQASQYALLHRRVGPSSAPGPAPCPSSLAIGPSTSRLRPRRAVACWRFLAVDETSDEHTPRSNQYHERGATMHDCRCAARVCPPARPRGI